MPIRRRSSSRRRRRVDAIDAAQTFHGAGPFSRRGRGPSGVAGLSSRRRRRPGPASWRTVAAAFRRGARKSARWSYYHSGAAASESRRVADERGPACASQRARAMTVKSALSTLRESSVWSTRPPDEGGGPAKSGVVGERLCMHTLARRGVRGKRRPGHMVPARLGCLASAAPLVPSSSHAARACTCGARRSTSSATGASPDHEACRRDYEAILAPVVRAPRSI